MKTVLEQTSLYSPNYCQLPAISECGVDVPRETWLPTKRKSQGRPCKTLRFLDGVGTRESAERAPVNRFRAAQREESESTKGSGLNMLRPLTRCSRLSGKNETVVLDDRGSKGPQTKPFAV